MEYISAQQGVCTVLVPTCACRPASHMRPSSRCLRRLCSALIIYHQSTWASLKGLNSGLFSSESSAAALCQLSAQPRQQDGNCDSPWLTGVPRSRPPPTAPLWHSGSSDKWAAESRRWCGGLKVLIHWHDEGGCYRRRDKKSNRTLRIYSTQLLCNLFVFNTDFLDFFWPPQQT